MHNVKLTILGLDLVGTSIGMAVRAAAPAVEVVGHDANGDRVARAKKLGAIASSHWNLLSACERADMLLLDLPLGEVEKTLTALQGELREGAVLLSTAPVVRPVLELAARLLPGVQFVGGHLVSPRLVPGQVEPSADLLRGATFYLIASPQVSAQALDMASGLAVAVGARPRYVDAAEHDGLAAGTFQLPILGVLGMLNALRASSGWQECAQCAGGELAAIGSTLGGELADASEWLLSDLDNALRWLDAYAIEMARLRGILAQKDRAALDAALKRAVEARAQCLSPRDEGGDALSGGADAGSAWKDLFLGGLGRRRGGM